VKLPASMRSTKTLVVETMELRQPYALLSRRVFVPDKGKPGPAVYTKRPKAHLISRLADDWAKLDLSKPRLQLFGAQTYSSPTSTLELSSWVTPEAQIQRDDQDA
jgi:hypothetical protein